MAETKYIVQSRNGVDGFTDLTIARKHAALNSPANIWLASDVIKRDGCAVHVKAGSEPLERTS